MKIFVRALGLIAVAAFASGCGGGGGPSASIAPVTPAGLQRTTDSVAPITPTLYVSGKGTVYAYNRDDAGDTAPKTQHGAFYNGAANTAVAGIATDRKGTLYVLVNYGTAAQGPGSPSCDVQSFAFSAQTATPATLQFQCGSTVFFGAGIQTAPNGEVDVLDTVDPSGVTGFQVERFSVTSGSMRTNSVLRLPSNRSYVGLAAGAAGNLFTLDTAPSSSTVTKYNAGVTGNAPSAATTTDVSLQTYTAIAAGRGTVAVSGADVDFTNFINIYNPKLTTMTQFGPLPSTITALAFDQAGNMYVGLSTASGTTIEVFPPGATDATAPMRVLNNPVRRGHPAGAVITGIAIAE